MSFQQNNCDRLWKLWYAILVFCIQALLTYNAVRQYLEFKEQSYDPKYGSNWSEIPMNFYIAMLVLSLALLPLFIYSALIKVGNFANDGVVMGKDPENLKAALMESGGRGGSGSDGGKPATHCRVVWRRLRRHLLPFNCFLHVISAFALMIPRPTLMGEQINNEVFPKYCVWNSDLDFIFRPDVAHPEAFHEIDWLTSQANMAISPEMCNLILALAILIVRFPNAFWFVSRSFAFTFSFFLFCTAIHIIIDFCAFSVVYKWGVNVAAVAPSNYIGFYPFTMGPWTLLVLEGISFIIILLSQIILYEYGHSQFIYSLRKYRSYISGGSTITTSPSDLGSDTASGCNAVVVRSCGEKSLVDGCCFRFWPNIVALCLLAVLLGLKVPVTLSYVQIYWKMHDPLLLTATIVNSIYLAVWLLVWFSFSVKTSWRFQVSLPMQTTSQDKMMVNHHPDPVYGCYHPSDQSADLLARFPGIVHNQGIGDCGSESSKTSSGMRGGSNYVYLQSNLPTIPTISEHMDGTASDASYETPPNRNGGMMGDSPGSIQLVQNPAGGFMAVRRGSKQQDNPPTYATLASIAAASGNPMLMHGMGRIPTLDAEMDNNEGSSNNGSSNGGGGTLNRNSRTRRSANRVTFKDHHDTIPGSPSQQLNGLPGSSSDSGMGGSLGLQQTSLQQYLATQQLRSKSPIGNLGTGYEDYAMFGNLFMQQPQQSVPQSSSMQGFPINSATYASTAMRLPGGQHGDADFMKVPDILMNEQGSAGDLNTGSLRTGQSGVNRSDSNDNLGIGMAYATNGSTQQTENDQSLCSQV